ncbi:MAG: hypothetical protein WA874_13250 [Chryseosolibacter sp.]
MSELELIENYFSGKLSQTDKAAFENKVEENMAFAEAVSFYILTRQSAHDILIEEKKRDFLNQYEQLARKGSTRDTGSRRWWLYGVAAAASVLLFVAYLTFFQYESPQQLADAYIDSTLTTLPTTMARAPDSLSMGIGAFNKKDYERAEIVFRSLGKNAELAAETTRYLGITYLRTEQYDQAIEQFDKLISFTGLYPNPGKFYLAITLMKRSKEGDEEEAKSLLQEVVSKKLPGYREASLWMEHL